MDRNTEVFKALLKPDFKWDNLDQDTLEGLGQEINDNKRIAHRVLGKLAIAQGNLKVRTPLKDFAKGIGIGENTLYAYKSVEDKFKNVEIAEDLSWAAMVALSKQKNPLQALSEAMSHGLSNAQIISTLKTEPAKKIVQCPNCKKVIEL